MKNTTLLSTLILILIASCDKDSPENIPQPASVKYSVIFEAVWSAETHPVDFPSNPHFSGLIGMTHKKTTYLFKKGNLASAGIKEMAETGGKSKLTKEITTYIDEGTAQYLINEGGISSSPGEISFTIDIDTSHSLISIVSMVAPSPDWFIAIENLDLFKDNIWTEEISLNVVLYDAGTDSGITYTAPNDPTDPPENIFEMYSLPPVLSSLAKPLGYFRFKKLED